jgi:F-type H+-transporting ATPase subunit b
MADEAKSAEAGAEAVGMPQLDFSTFPNQIFWLVVTLVAIYFLLNKIALPRIAGVLHDRQGRITQDLASAEELKMKAEEAEAAYEKALADARSEAQRIVGEAKDEMTAKLAVETEKADAQIAEKLVESEARIEEVRAGAVEAVKTVSEDAAGEIVSALGLKLDKSDVAAAIAERMKG